SCWPNSDQRVCALGSLGVLKGQVWAPIGPIGPSVPNRPGVPDGCRELAGAWMVTRWHGQSRSWAATHHEALIALEWEPKHRVTAVVFRHQEAGREATVA